MPSLVVFRFLSADGVDCVTSALFNVAFVWRNKCGGTCQGSSVPDPVTSCLFREARGQGTHTYLSPPQASSGSPGEQPECSGGPPPPPTEWTSTNSHLFNSFNLLPPRFPSLFLLSWLVGHPFSDLRHKPSSQPELLLTSCSLHLSVTKRCLFFLQSIFGMGPLLSLLQVLPDESPWHLTGALEEASSRALMPLACLVSSPCSMPL